MIDPLDLRSADLGMPHRRRLSAHGHDKIVTLLRAVAAECDDPDDAHKWTKCRHCLALEALNEKPNRVLLRALLAEERSDA